MEHDEAAGSDVHLHDEGRRVLDARRGLLARGVGRRVGVARGLRHLVGHRVARGRITIGIREVLVVAAGGQEEGQGEKRKDGTKHGKHSLEQWTEGIRIQVRGSGMETLDTDYLSFTPNFLNINIILYNIYYILSILIKAEHKICC